MKIIPYSEDRFHDCVEIFASNLGKYFADYELNDFKSYLKKVLIQNTYFVLIENEDVIACGGYEKEGKEIGLTWGMVKRTHHRKGFGRELTLFRLAAIKRKYSECIVKIDTSQHTEGFYKKQGFRTQSIEKGGFTQGIDKYTMTLNLTS